MKVTLAHAVGEGRGEGRPCGALPSAEKVRDKPRMPYLALAHAGRIHYAERGEARAGRAPVVFIHGAGGSAAIWNMVLARVARETRAIAIDLPGHGPSEVAGTALDGTPELSLVRYRDALGELAGTLCLGASVLVGHSLGAQVAIEAALAWPDKVRALVLVASAARLTVDPELAHRLRDDPPGALTWLADHALSPRAKPGVRRGFLAAGPVVPPEVARADYDIVAATDLRDRVAKLTCPVTWIDGADDHMSPATDGRPGEIVTVPDAGHLVPIEAPAVIADVVRAMIHAL
jgi:pimeloyl-ACP methyl ester carboxylesterase